MMFIRFTVGDNRQEVAIDRLVVAGWVGKDRAALQKHIDELAALGVKPPGQTPTYMNLSPSILTQAGRISVVGPASSGEVEAVVITDRSGNQYLTVGSDHTDRDFEKYDIPASKQMCGKPIAAAAWPLREVKEHRGELILRSWMTCDGERRLYQEGALGANRDLFELLDGLPSGCVAPGESFCLFCGTFAAKGGLSYGQHFEMELYDPVRNRSISHAYDVQVLPQYL